MIARKCDICGTFFTPYLASNAVSGEKNSYYRIEVTESAFINETARSRQGYDVTHEKGSSCSRL